MKTYYLDQIYTKNNCVLDFKIDDDHLLAINYKSGFAYMLNQPGSRVWMRINGERSLRDIKILIGEFRNKKTSITKSFINELRINKLIVRKRGGEKNETESQ